MNTLLKKHLASTIRIASVLDRKAREQCKYLYLWIYAEKNLFVSESMSWDPSERSINCFNLINNLFTIQLKETTHTTTKVTLFSSFTLKISFNSEDCVYTKNAFSMMEGDVILKFYHFGVFIPSYGSSHTRRKYFFSDSAVGYPIHVIDWIQDIRL